MTWSYFFDKEDKNNTLKFISPEIGLAKEHIDIRAVLESSLASQVEKVELFDLLFFVSTGKKKSVDDNIEIPLEKSSGKFSTKIVLSKLSNQMQIYTLRITSIDGSISELAQLVFFPLSHQPKVTLVLGSPRSGTTTVGQMVQIGFAVESHGESHVSQGFELLCNQAEQYFTESKAAKTKGTLCNEVPSLFLKSQLILAMRNLYQRLYRGADIVDKTPGNQMLQSLPLFFLAFPQTKVIYCKRRGIENIESRLRKFPNVTFKGHCEQWSRNLKLWNKVKKEISKKLKSENWFFELEQHELANNGEVYSKKMVKFLEVPDTRLPSIINYQSQNVLQKTAIDHQSTKSLEDTGWSADQKQLFKDICGNVMKSNNYSYEEKYYLTSEQPDA